MSKEKIFTQGDYGIELEYPIADELGPVNLTGCSVLLTVVDEDKNLVSDSEMMQVTDPEAGKVSFILQEKHTENTGVHMMYFKVVNSTSSVTTQTSDNYYVMPLNGEEG